jgi:apolipoprotein N-acyltransferase
MFTRFLGAVLSAMLLAIAFPLTLPGMPKLWGVALPQIQLPGWDSAGGFAQLSWLCFFALVPLLETIRRSRRPGEAFLWAYFAGALWLVMHLAWFSSFGVLPVFLSAMYLALPVGAFGWAAYMVLREPCAGQVMWGLPAIWVGIEYLRIFGTWIMPWNFLGYSQVRNLPIIQVAELGGVFAVSYLIALANVALFLLLSPIGRFRPRLGLVCLAGAVLLGALAFGELRLTLAPAAKKDQQQRLKLALVQGGLETFESWDRQMIEQILDQYIPPSTAALRDWQRYVGGQASQSYYTVGPRYEPDLLVIWPEAVLPRSIDPRHAANMPYQIGGMLRAQEHAALLMGVQGRPKSNKRPENGCLLVEPDGMLLWPYSKLRLVPYGEVVPFRGIVRFLQYPWGKDDICEGRTLEPLTWRGHKFGLMVCYDNCWTFISREQVRQGAQVLVVMTNNSWYKLHSGVRQHCDEDIMRAVEYHRPMARCSTTGWSQLIDPLGRIMDSTKIDSAGSIVSWVKPEHGATPYLLLGDLFAQLCLVGAVLLVLRAALSSKSEGFL